MGGGGGENHWYHCKNETASLNIFLFIPHLFYSPLIVMMYLPLDLFRGKKIFQCVCACLMVAVYTLLLFISNIPSNLKCQCFCLISFYFPEYLPYFKECKTALINAINSTLAETEYVNEKCFHGHCSWNVLRLSLWFSKKKKVLH